MFHPIFVNYMEQQIINNGESGLSVRNKINGMFANLISGSEGINAIWKQIGINLNYTAEIGNVETLNATSKAWAEIYITGKKFIFNFGIPQGYNGGMIIIRKTYSSVAEMNADKNPTGDDGLIIDGGQIVSVFNPSNPDENAFYSRTADGWKLQLGVAKEFRDEMKSQVNSVKQEADKSKTDIQSLVNALPVTQQTGDSTTSVMSQKAVTDALDSALNSPLNYVESVEDIEVKWTSDAYIDSSNNIVALPRTYCVKNLNIAGYAAIETNAGWYASARTLILDADGVVLKNVTYNGEDPTNRDNKTISLRDYPTATMVSISSGHNNNLYVRGVKITDKTIQDYLNEYDLTKIAELENELRPITIYPRANGFYNKSPIWNSSTAGFSVKSTDPVNLLVVKEGMTFHYAGKGIGSAVNYAFYDANKKLISSVVGQNLLAGIDVAVPAGAKYAFFQSFSESSDPETVSFALTTNDLFRPYIEGLVDVKTLNTLKASNILWGKKYVAIGDSFTDVIGTEKITEDGPYKGSSKVYPYIIGNRNNMGVLNQGASGSILGGYIVAKRYEKIPEDVDYITIWYGINDTGHGIAVGTADDTVETWATEKDGSTGAAFNWIFNWIFTNRPYVHIGVIITDFCEQNRREVIMECCRRWGVAYLDLYDPTIPMIRTRGSKIVVNDTIKNLRNKYFSIDGGSNIHPNNKAHQWQANIVEHFMRGL